MNAPRVAARLLLAVLLPSMLLSLASLPAQAPPPVEPPQRFERILWVSDLAQTVRAASALGFTGVQLGAGADPAPVVAAGLSFYLDQPIGKGALELRDTDVTPLRQAYEKTRDPAVLVRPGCLARSEFVDRLAAAAAAEARRVAGPGLLFVALADEASMPRHDAPLDLCWCGDCLAEFRRFAERRYRTIDALNAAFGTQYATFADVVPVSTDQVRRRELGDTRLPADLRAFAARLDFVDAQFPTAVTRIQRAVAAAVAGVPVGLTGTSAPAAFGGGDPARLLPQLTLAEPYAVGGAEALTASLL
ncbi:MAG: beta-galactosidase, partial [Planctomycetes bacterium]|nr:beta-galactosidase [Planctomycetota bacterium]